MQQKNYNRFLGFLLSFHALIFTFFILCASGSYAQITDGQRIAELQQQIEALEQEADQYRGAISGQQAKARTLESEISILNNQIKKIQTQIYITSKNIDKTELEIDGLEGNIFDAQERINYKKETMGILLRSLYKQDSESLIEVLLKHNNLSDFLKETYYASTFNTALLDLVNEVKTEKKEMEEQKFTSEKKKQDLEYLNSQQQSQNYALDKTKIGKNQILKETKGQEAVYQDLLEEVERQKTLFFTELKEIETKVIQGGLYLLEVTAENVPPKGTDLFRWPEDGFRITQGYGRTAYSRRGAYGGAPHNGIDMASGFGTPVMAIGDGEIIANGKSDGWGNWVAIKHPPYNLVSVYGHFSAFEFLRVGTQVRVGQIIGYEGATGNATGSHLHLSVYKKFFTYINDRNGQLYFNYFDGTINPLDYLP